MTMASRSKRRVEPLWRGCGFITLAGLLLLSACLQRGENAQQGGSGPAAAATAGSAGELFGRGQDALKKAQTMVDFPIVLPCWLPEDIDSRNPQVLVHGKAVRLSYRSRIARRLGGDITIMEYRSSFDWFVMSGARLELHGVAAVIDDKGAGEIRMEWIAKDVDFQLTSRYSREDTLRVVSSMIQGCSR